MKQLKLLTLSCSHSPLCYFLVHKLAFTRQDAKKPLSYVVPVIWIMPSPAESSETAQKREKNLENVVSSQQELPVVFRGAVIPWN